MLFVYRKQSNERIHIRRMWAPRVGNFHNPSSSVVKTRHVLFDVQQVCLLLKIVAISQNARSVGVWTLRLFAAIFPLQRPRPELDVS